MSQMILIKKVGGSKFVRLDLIVLTKKIGGSKFVRLELITFKLIMYYWEKNYVNNIIIDHMYMYLFLCD